MTAAVSDLYAPPQTASPVRASAAGTLATRTSRLCAAIIDSALVMMLMTPTWWLAGFIDPLRPLQAPSLAMIATMALSGFLAFVLLNGFLLHRHGQSIGKAVLAIRIVRKDGDRAGFWRLVLLRHGVVWFIAFLPWGLGDLLRLTDVLFIFRHDHACLHDDLADTCVVRS